MASGTISLPDDTGWIDCTLGSNFKLYDSDANDSVAKYRRIRNIVSVVGTVSPKSSLTISSANNLYIITTLPSGFRPPHVVKQICQGPSQYVWLLQVDTDGEISLSRYRITNSSSYTNCPANAWLPFHVLFEV